MSQREPMVFERDERDDFMAAELTTGPDFQAGDLAGQCRITQVLMSVWAENGLGACPRLRK